MCIRRQRGATNAEEVVKLGFFNHFVCWLGLSVTGETVGRGSSEAVLDVTIRGNSVRRWARNLGADFVGRSRKLRGVF